MTSARLKLLLPASLGLLAGVVLACAPAHGQHIRFGDYPERFFDNPNALAMACAISKGDADSIDRLIAAGADVNAQGSGENNLLSWCLLVENKDAFVRLLKAGADPNRPLGDDCETVVTLTFGDRVDSSWFELMLDNGLDPDTIVFGGSTPILVLAAEYKDDSRLRSLIKHRGVNLNARETEFKKTAALSAAMVNRFDNVLVLLEAGADFTAKDWCDVDLAYLTLTSRNGPTSDSERVLDFLKAHKVDLDAAARRAMSHDRLDVEWWTKEQNRKSGESLAEAAEEPAPAEVSKPVDVELLPYYCPTGPVVNVGTFSGRLAKATEKTIREVAAQMQKELKTLPVEAMFVLAVRLYDLGYKEEAVYWFLAAKYRMRLFREALAPHSTELGSAPFESQQAQYTLYVLISETINPILIDEPAIWIAAAERVCAASGNVPAFRDTYKGIQFVDSPALARANGTVAKDYFQLLRLAKKWHGR